ncbi:aspartate kinase [Thiomicrorhabdus cannonii]|uniref:aspartate kinase n=1 Tax=Thiomicrorhabdus cannonii TaxID=2748011 RepID=UPI0015BE51CE|nr:aspartate kinase [Thiomicrorhabdus cannonii]
MPTLTVEKIGGTSMSHYAAVRDNIVRYPGALYQRILVVSAYGGITDALLEHKKTGQAGVFALFADGQDWRSALNALQQRFHAVNAGLFDDELLLARANAFIAERLLQTEELLSHLQSLCRHGHFSLESHLLTVRELLASLGEAHSAWNLTELLRAEGVNAKLIDLTGWQNDTIKPLDSLITDAFDAIDLNTTLPIVTGYAHCSENLMHTFDRGYSEMTFSRIAVLTAAGEAVIHKEYHLSSADPRIVGESQVVPIGKTNYDIADQLANLGMEAIHPRAAKGLRQAQIPLRIKNTFEPQHHGTLISDDYVSQVPQVEIIAGMSRLVALEIFDQEMLGQQADYERRLHDSLQGCEWVTKDFNANTITLYVRANLSKLKALTARIETLFPNAQVSTSKIALVSVMGSDMALKGLLAKAVQTLSDQAINIEAVHQNPRQVEMQFMVNEDDYADAVKALHRELIEIHNHGEAICVH